jgi:TnpA family transposase
VFRRRGRSGLRCRAVPVEFLSDAEASAYGRFSCAPSRVELERVFFLDDADRALVDRRRGVHNRLGFALQLGVAPSVARKTTLSVCRR